MNGCNSAYEVILQRHQVAGFVTENLDAIKRVFVSLDRLAVLIGSHDDQLTEVINSLADLLRGTLAERHGVDVSPTSDLGPSEPIDLNHTFRVLSQLIGDMSAGGFSSILLSALDRRDLYQRVVDIEEGLNAFEVHLRAINVERNPIMLESVKCRVADLRSSHLLSPDQPRLRSNEA